MAGYRHRRVGRAAKLPGFGQCGSISGQRPPRHQLLQLDWEKRPMCPRNQKHGSVESGAWMSHFIDS
jgi:hypothetical protein